MDFPMVVMRVDKLVSKKEIKRAVMMVDWKDLMKVDL